MNREEQPTKEKLRSKGFLGFLGFLGFMGFQAFAFHSVWQLFYFCLFGFFVNFRFFKKGLGYVGI